MDKPPFGIVLRPDCTSNARLNQYKIPNQCFPLKMCHVIPYAKKMAKYYAKSNPNLSRQWEEEVLAYTQYENDRVGDFGLNGCGGGRRRTRRRGARSSRRRPTR